MFTHDWMTQKVRTLIKICVDRPNEDQRKRIHSRSVRLRSKAFNLHEQQWYALPVEQSLQMRFEIVGGQKRVHVRNGTVPEPTMSAKMSPKMGPKMGPKMSPRHTGASGSSNLAARKCGWCHRINQTTSQIER